MKIDQELPALLSRGRLFHLFVGEEDDYEHCFGGSGLPLEGPGGREILRQVFQLDLSDPRLGFQDAAGARAHLFYAFESCSDVEYRLDADGQLDLLSRSDRDPYPDWPYPDYPVDYPVSPLRLEEVEFDDLERVIQAYAYFAKLRYNEENFDPEKHCYVVAMPRSEYGVSLWGEEGDRALVSVGFSIDLESRIVRSTQACG